MSGIVVRSVLRLLLVSPLVWGSWAHAQESNPRVIKATDPSLKKEFEYLVFDLGKGIDLKLVKVAARGKTFTIGTTKEEQEKVVRDYFDGKKPNALDNEEAASITLTDDFYIGQFEVYRAQFRRFVEETKYVTDAEMLEGGYGYSEEAKKRRSSRAGTGNTPGRTPASAAPASGTR